MIFTKTGFRLYSFFTKKELQGVISTDRDFKYSLPDGTMYDRIDQVEDWIIKMAEQIKSERMQILINK